MRKHIVKINNFKKVQRILGGGNKRGIFRIDDVPIEKSIAYSRHGSELMGRKYDKKSG